MANKPQNASKPGIMTNRKIVGERTQQDRTNPAVGFDLFESSVVEEVFGDGISQSIIGPANTRLTFYRVDSVDREGESLIEKRRPVLNVVVPTVALVNFFGFFMTQISANGEGLVAALDEFKASLRHVNKEAQEAVLLAAALQKKA